jgi:hypothetical protein
MDSVWFMGSGKPARQQQNWYLLVGRGENIRFADLPFPYTKRMSHHFAKAPSNLCVLNALRWGQIRAMGGSPRLARALLNANIGWASIDERRRAELIRLFIATPETTPAEMVQVIECVESQFDVRWRVVAPGFLEAVPPPPHFTLKGRTVASLLRLANEQAREDYFDKPPVAAHWPPSGLASAGWSWRHASSPSELWRMKELCTQRALAEEGRAMRNCAATYGYACSLGRISIWSLTVETPGGRKRALTVEVRTKEKTVVQAKRRFNASPNVRDLGMLSIWAVENGLTVQL